MASLFSFRQTYRYLQRQAHEQPVIFYSLVIGLIGPVMLVTVPPIRKTLGYSAEQQGEAMLADMGAQAELTRTTVPKRERRPVQGYEDE
ncbi:hypothetical protein VTO73DRAFT_6328 [Trametes versicolor]